MAAGGDSGILTAARIGSSGSAWPSLTKCQRDSVPRFYYLHLLARDRTVEPPSPHNREGSGRHKIAVSPPGPERDAPAQDSFI